MASLNEKNTENQHLSCAKFIQMHTWPLLVTFIFGKTCWRRHMEHLHGRFLSPARHLQLRLKAALWNVRLLWKTHHHHIKGVWAQK